MLVLGTLLLLVAGVCGLVATGLIGLTDSSVRRRMEPAYAAKSQAEIALQPGEGRRQAWGRHLVSGSMLASIERDVQLAGHPRGLSVSRVLAMKLAAPVTVIALGAIVALMNGLSLPGMMLWLAATAVAYVVPGVVVASRARVRQEAIDLALPDVLDQLTITIDAGMSLESAIARTSERTNGPLADELSRTIQDVRLGMSRQEAYSALLDRTDSESLKRFIRSIQQAQEFGVPVAQTVRQQANDLRTRRRLQAEAKASKVPVKLLFPMMVCIFPVLFIIALVPPIVNASASW